MKESYVSWTGVLRTSNHRFVLYLSVNFMTLTSMLSPFGSWDRSVFPLRLRVPWTPTSTLIQVFYEIYKVFKLCFMLMTKIFRISSSLSKWFTVKYFKGNFPTFFFFWGILIYFRNLKIRLLDLNTSVVLVCVENRNVIYPFYVRYTNLGIPVV